MYKVKSLNNMKKMYKKPSTEQMNVQPASIIATSIIIGNGTTEDLGNLSNIEAD